MNRILLLSLIVGHAAAQYLNSSSMVVSDFVDCGDNLACHNDFPICCSDQPKPYCLPAGEKCCPQKYAGTERGCKLNETCCGSGSGFECCDSESSCIQGRCVKDVQCRHFATKDQCLNGQAKELGCGWCCNLNTCQSERGYCETDSTCSSENPRFRTKCQWLTESKQTCPDPCNQHTSCTECRAIQPLEEFQCGWCCSSGLCQSTNPKIVPSSSKCRPLSWIPNFEQGFQLRCEQCEEGGNGLYHIQSMLLMVLFCLLLPSFCVFVALMLFFKRCCARLGYLDLEDWTESENQESDADSQCAIRQKVAKYGFDGDEVDGDDWAEVGFERRKAHVDTHGKCALCMTFPANVVFLPCYHCYCCSECSIRLERHASKDKNGKLLCPFCRQCIETMVNLDKVYKLADSGMSVSPDADSMLAGKEPEMQPTSSSGIHDEEAGEDDSSESRDGNESAELSEEDCVHDV